MQGALAGVRNAILPLIAALGGFIAPGSIYAMSKSDTYALNGWAIPAATDIAFAIGICAMLGCQSGHSCFSPIRAALPTRRCPAGGAS